MTEPASPPPRPGSGLLRGLGVATLVVVLALLAFVGGLVATAAVQLLSATEDETVTVRPTAGVVHRIRDLARLQTVTFHMERVIDMTSEQSRFWGRYTARDTLLLVAAADVTAGVDLSRVAEDDVDIDADAGSVTLRLPPPTVFSTALDAERTYVHDRSTELLARRQEGLEAEARKVAARTLEEAAVEAGVLDHARTGAERTLEGLVRALGYEDVRIEWADR